MVPFGMHYFSILNFDYFEVSDPDHFFYITAKIYEFYIGGIRMNPPLFLEFLQAKNGEKMLAISRLTDQVCRYSYDNLAYQESYGNS